MKTRPILFSTPMIQALLDGRKTITRRAIKWEALHKQAGISFPSKVRLAWFRLLKNWGLDAGDGVMREVNCPYGKPGDLLWVRETLVEDCNHSVSLVGYKAGVAFVKHPWDCPRHYIPSIHMKRIYSRLTLEITDIRVERLNDISEEDAKAEGIFFTDYGRNCFHYGGPPADVGDCPSGEVTHPQRNGWSWKNTKHHDQCLGTARTGFMNLWQSINGPDSWEANPWVWCVSFRVHKMNVDAFIWKEGSAA